MLGANAVAALEQIDRAEQLRESEATLRERDARLARLREVDDQIREISRRLVAADTRDAAEAAVCERLAAVDRYAMAWVGTVDPGRERLSVRASAGGDGSYLESVDRSVFGNWSDLPAAAAVRDDAPVVVESVAEDFQTTPWRQAALSRDYRSVAAIPVGYDSVLSVYATDADAFDGETLSVLEDLALLLSHTLASIARRDALRSPGDRFLELELAPDPGADPLWAVTDGVPSMAVTDVYTAGETVGVRGSIPSGAVEALRERAAAVHGVEGLQLIDSEGDQLFRLSLSSSSLGSLLAESGGRLDDLSVDGDTLHLSVVLPSSVRAQSVVSRLRSTCANVTLLAKREYDSDGDDGDLLGPLTDRQREALLAAYEQGFFDWPREHTAEEVASTLGISRPTFTEHLRVAERTLLDALLGE
jgi:predicted DNA binding protein